MRSGRLEATTGNIVLMAELSAVMVLAMMLIHIVMTMMGLLILGHMHVAISLVILRPAHQTVLSLVAIL